jgi:hypothetical protein
MTHIDRVAILVLNVVLGITFIIYCVRIITGVTMLELLFFWPWWLFFGWIIALVWASMKSQREKV